MVFRQRLLFFNKWGALDSGGLNSNYRMSEDQKKKNTFEFRERIKAVKRKNTFENTWRSLAKVGKKKG